MKTLTLLLLFFASQLSAITLDALIEKSLQQAPSLQSILSRIDANAHAIEVSDAFANPELSVTKNTLDSSQAMSQTVVTLKQNIPYYNKRSTRKEVSLAEDALLKEQLFNAKTVLVEKIKESAYTIWEIKEDIRIIENYIALTQQNIDLYESYTSVSDNQHMGIMKAELSLADLKIEKSKLRSKLRAAYAQLSYLAAVEVNELEIDLTIEQKPQLKTVAQLTHNPALGIKTKELKKEQAKVAVADINNYPDINLIAGYAYREKFDDYFNVGVAISLPIYSTEDELEEKSRADALSVASQRDDVVLSINAQLKDYYAQMLSAYEIYHIVEDEALPQVAHMFELSSSSIAVGGDLFKYIDVLFDKLALEKKQISAIGSYHKAQAKIEQLQGDLL